MSRARNYQPPRKVPVKRSDHELNDHGGGITGRIRHRFAELASCSGTQLNTCTFLFVWPGQTVAELETDGQGPASLVIFSIERLDHEQAKAVFRSGCRSSTPDTPRLR